MPSESTDHKNATPAEAAESTVSDGIDVQDGRHVFLTRAQAARRMGVSLATVRRMEGEELHPILVNGKHCFAVEELDRHRKVTDGDLAAKAFEMFNADSTQVDVVIALREPPERIRSLFNDWTAMSECIVAGPPGIGGRRLQTYLKPRLTRRLVWACINIVMRDSKLRARAESEVGVLA